MGTLFTEITDSLLATKSKEEKLVIPIFAGNLFLRIFKITGWHCKETKKRSEIPVKQQLRNS